MTLQFIYHQPLLAPAAYIPLLFPTGASSVDTRHLFLSGLVLRAGLDVLVEVEDILGVIPIFQSRQARELLPGVCPQRSGLTLVGHSMDITAARERFQRLSVSTCESYAFRILCSVCPTCAYHTLSECIPVTESRLLICHVGNRANVGLDIGAGHHGRVCISHPAVHTAGQKGPHGLIRQLTEVVTFPVAAHPMLLAGTIVHALQFDIRHLARPFGERGNARAQGGQQPPALIGVADPDIPDADNALTKDLGWQ